VGQGGPVWAPGAAIAEVPDVVGMPEDDAITAITDAGLIVGSIGYECSDTVPAGDVISQNPPPGTEVDPGSSVNLVVSSGQPEVPDVVGMTEEEAAAAIDGTDYLSVGEISYECSDVVDAGLVISTDPPAGTPAPCDSAVNMVVSTGRCVIPVNVDIKPGSCPNPLNVRSQGVIPVAVLGAEDFDVNDIDPASVELAGVGAIRSSYEDVAAPVVDGNECDCTGEGPDGYVDLTLKFKTQRVVMAIADMAEPDAQLTLTLTGVLRDGTPIEGVDCMIIVGQVPPVIDSMRADINGDGKVNGADLLILKKAWYTEY
ncbi:MAG: PASTA domain-containing protein, partial [Planctomycetota bacterium]